MPSTLALANQYRSQVARRDQDTTRTLVDHYRAIYRRLQDQLSAVVTYIRQNHGNEPLTLQLLYREHRIQALKRQIELSLDRFAGVATDTTTQTQKTAIVDGINHATGLMQSQEPSISVEFNRIHHQALQNVLGISGSGKPLKQLFDEISQPTADDAIKGIVTNLALGQPVKAISDDLQDDLGIGLTRSLLIARTETHRAYVNANIMTYSDNDDVVETWIWKSYPDACPSCLAMCGQEMSSPDVELESHPNCVIGGTLVNGPTILGSFTRWYDGKIIDIITASGKILSVTPNHPILTPNGWVNAGFLAEGSYIVCSRFGERDLSWYPDDYHIPTEIEDVAETLSTSNFVSTVSMPVSAEDFHNDGIGSQISIVRANSLLWGGGDPSLFQPELKESFCRAHSQNFVLPGDSPSASFIQTMLSTSDSIMSSSNILDVLFGSPPGHHQTVGFRLGSQGNTCIGQYSGNRSTTNPEFFSQLLYGNTGLISFDKVVRVNVHDFVGHVYNLQTTKGYYIANGIITHNCRCQAIPKVKNSRLKIKTGQEIFDEMSDSQKQDLLGPQKYRLYLQGKIQLADMVHKTHSERWGNGRRVATISEALANAKRRK